jgi:hypothetical protein
MPGEYPAKVAKDFVEKVCSFLDGKFGFHIYQNCYEGKNAATVLVDGERVRFDIILFQTRRDTSSSTGILQQKINYFCECKWRKNSNYLKSELKKFLKKALRTTPEIQEQCSDNFGFIFICNTPFEVSQANLQDIEYLQGFLDSNYSTTQLTHLSRRVGILTLTDWFIELTLKGGI